ncbi:hypothetical protein EW145_g6672 [Phellinidium pouzarii]|uniref:SNF5-domain-containing protein n=1 Tax=Phellinidium pouzarii TaxID=167371 RepID=A0A4S4KWE2_9AGAM|nr:hypothetical protein EW145_g6672 [Phellinidium pouzarii]
MPSQPPSGMSSFQASLSTMATPNAADAQLRAALNSLQNAAAQGQYAKTPRQVPVSTTGMFEAKNWTAATFEAKQWAGAATTPTPTKTAPRQRNRATRGTPGTSTPAPIPNYAQNNAYVQQAQMASRPSASTIPPSTLPVAPAVKARDGGGVVNYAEPDSGDELEREPDAGERDRDSEDSDFAASGGTRSAIRATRSRATGANGFYQYSFSGSPAPQASYGKQELDQSYLGLVPPSKYVTTKRAEPTRHEYPPPDALETQALKSAALVPIRVEFETDAHRIRDCFIWDLHDDLIKPEAFARIFCADLDLPVIPWAETVANQIRAQLEEYEGIASMDLGSGVDGYVETTEDESMDVEVPECRVILSIDVQIATYHLMDHIEWDLLSPLTPEAFAQRLCADIGLTGEAAPLIAHALLEEILKHKKDAIEWGVIGGDTVSARDVMDESPADRDKREKGVMKDKTGLGLGPGSWGRAPRDGLGRGPRALKSVWRDWNDSEEYATRFEVLSAEEVERREVERERASRYALAEGDIKIPVQFDAATKMMACFSFCLHLACDLAFFL